MIKAALSFAVALGVLLASGPSGVAEAAEADETKEICARAEKRYAAIETPKAVKPGTVVVKMYKYTFCPRELTVKAGTTVHWINVDKRTSHSVWLKQAGEKESERMFPEEHWSFTFAAPGGYPYLCGPHGEQEGMVGKVTVTK